MMRSDELRSWLIANGCDVEEPATVRRSRTSPVTYVLCAVVVIGLLRRTGQHEAERSEALLALGDVLVLAGFALALFGGRLLRLASVERSLTSSLRTLTRAQRWQVGRQAVGKRPVTPAEVPLAREVALRTSEQLRCRPQDVGAGLVLVGQTLTESGLAANLMLGALLAGAAFLIPYTVVSARQARRFLATHPAPGR